jgi:hypothetical protein
MKTLMLFFSCLVCFIPVVSAGSPSPHNMIRGLREAYDKDVQKLNTDSTAAVQAVFRKYTNDISVLELRLKKEGNLEALLACRTEIKRLELDKAVPKASPVNLGDDVIKMQEAYRQAVALVELNKDKKVYTLMSAFLLRLDGLKKQFTMKDKIEDALAVKEEMDKLALELAEQAKKLPEGFDPNAAPSGDLEDKAGSVLPPQLKKSMILHYPFSSSEGTKVADSSGKTNQGKSFGAKWTPRGKLGGAYDFDGQRDYIDAGSSSDYDFDTFSDWSFAFWVHPKGRLNSTFLYHRAGPNNNADGGENYLYYQTESTPHGLSWGSINGEWDTGVTLAQDQWQHIIAMYNASEKKAYVYVNGTRKAEVQVQSVGHSSGSLKIGHGANGNSFKGMIDEVMIFSRALTDQEIHAISDRQK